MSSMVVYLQDNLDYAWCTVNGPIELASMSKNKFLNFYTILLVLYWLMTLESRIATPGIRTLLKILILP